jgi:hypothetical protein
MPGTKTTEPEARDVAGTTTAKPPVRWRDGNTMLSFGVFGAVVLSLMALRVADPSNWIAVDAAAPMPLACTLPDR